MRTAVALAFLGMTAAHAAPGDVWRVQGQVVNLRAGPSTDHAVVAQVREGDTFTEVSRRSGWLEVRLGADGERSAWIYAALVEPARPGTSGTTTPSSQAKPPAEAAPDGPAFAEFRREFRRFNDTMAETLGTPYFREARQTDETTIRVTATSRWLSEDEDARRQKAETVLYMWQAAQPRRRQVSVMVVGPDGQPQMRVPE